MNTNLLENLSRAERLISSIIRRTAPCPRMKCVRLHWLLEPKRGVDFKSMYFLSISNVLWATFEYFGQSWNSVFWSSRPRHHSTSCIGRLNGLHAIPAVGPYGIVRVNPSRDDTDIQMMFRTSVIVWTWTQAWHGHLINFRTGWWFLDGKKSARLLALTL